MIIKITKIKALIGETIRIKKAPIIVPIKAPKTGIKAVKPTNAEIAPEYGMLKISIPIKQRIPMIKASVTWPVIKLENVTNDR